MNFLYLVLYIIRIKSPIGNLWKKLQTNKLIDFRNSFPISQRVGTYKRAAPKTQIKTALESRSSLVPYSLIR